MLNLDAATGPEAPKKTLSSGIEEEESSPPRKKLKKDAGHSASTEQLQLPSKILERVDEEEPKSNFAQIMDQSKMQQNKEEDVGIIEFVSPDLTGFTGILKKRYTDFLVNEILPNGEVVHLTTVKFTPHSEDSSDRVALPNDAVQSSSNPAEIQGPSKRKALEAKTPQEDAVKSEPASKEPVVRSAEEGFKPRATEDETQPKTHAEELKRNSVDEELKSEQPQQKQPATSEDLDMMQPGSDSTAADTTVEIPTGSTGSSKPDPVSSVAKWQNFASLPNDFKLSPADFDSLKVFFEPDVIGQITALCNRISNSPHRKPKEYGQVRTAPIKDREARTKIHQELRRIYKSYLESYTDDTGAMIISAAPTNNLNKNGGAHSGWHGPTRGQNSGAQRQKSSYRPGWKDLGGDHLHFTLYKENKDTMEVISYLARQLKLGPQAFQFAGTKDRRGVTAQRVSVYRVHAERMMQVGRTLRNAKIGNYKYEPRSLELGELMGNEFVITLRDCQFQSGAESEDMNMSEHALKAIEDVKNAAKHVSEKGFLNYFGLQRFGTFATRTDTIGKKMLQGDFKGAVEAILQYHPSALEAAQDESSRDETISTDDKNRAAAIHSFQTTRQGRLALDILPRKFSAEAAVMRHLGVAARANDYQGALQSIPKNLRLMYVHAYQSLIWNLAASHRWQQSGEKLLPGDLVLVNEHKEMTSAATETEQVDADGEVIVHPAANDSAALEEDRFIRARHLTAEDVASGQYSVHDIVLPTPGFDILYPDNIIKDFYEKTMASELGGELNPHDMRRQWKDISLSGSYRKLLAKPMGGITVKPRLYTHSEQEEQFVQTDVDMMYEHRDQQNKGHSNRGDAKANDKSVPESKVDAAPSGPQEAPLSGESVLTNKEQAPEAAENEEHADREHGTSPSTEQDQKKPAPRQKLAFIVKMQLGSSQYATMALRELMKLGVRTYKPDFGGGR
ncbi:hypothetical protein MMC30_009296 [Trapelia coarctata]|nr:hypothetical protein [Trapelia coarctata]